MFDRLPARDDPRWADAPLEAILRPLTSDYIGCASTPVEEEPEPVPQQGKRRKWQKLTAEDEGRIAALIQTGMRYAEIALEAGVGQSTVERVAYERGIGRGRGRQGKGDPCATPGCGHHLGAHNRSGVCTHCQTRGRR